MLINKTKQTAPKTSKGTQPLCNNQHMLVRA